MDITLAAIISIFALAFVMIGYVYLNKVPEEQKVKVKEKNDSDDSVMVWDEETQSFVSFD